MAVRADPLEFEGRRALITAGTKGAGRATVERFLAGGRPSDDRRSIGPGGRFRR